MKVPAHILAGETDRWTEIMLRALSNRVARRWHFVSFRGKTRGEWRGIVDLVAIRKDTSQPASKNLKRGDLFDIILIQLKGGSARHPSPEDLRRLRAVAKQYSARAVVLFQWKLGEYATFEILNFRTLTWEASTSKKIFG